MRDSVSEASCAKNRFSCMTVSCLCSNNSLSIIECLFLFRGSLLILHFVIMFFSCDEDHCFKDASEVHVVSEIALQEVICHGSQKCFAQLYKYFQNSVATGEYYFKGYLFVRTYQCHYIHDMPCILECYKATVQRWYVSGFIMSACACTCGHLKHTTHTFSVSLIYPPASTSKGSFEKVIKMYLLIFSESEICLSRQWSVEAAKFRSKSQGGSLDNSQLRWLCARGCTEVSLNRLWQKFYCCDYSRELRGGLRIDVATYVTVLGQCSVGIIISRRVAFVSSSSSSCDVCIRSHASIITPLV